MHTSRSYKALALAAGLVVLVGVPSSLVLGATACCEGTWWLKASRDIRNGYVSGFTQGLTYGFGEGCLAGTKGVQASEPGLDADPLRRCLAKGYAFSQPTDQYVKLITDFYRRYPGDRDMPIFQVLVRLLQGLGLEEIHLEPKPHRPTPNGKHASLQPQSSVASTGAGR